ncbi:MAG TPA: hypothetical protein VGR98_01535 [Streptosporangiaceae bacterium]|nr:hypothetical protein [Streptosporangiaceae bacterium]
MRPAILRGDALRRVGVQDAHRCPQLQPLAVTEGLDPDRDGCRARANAVPNSPPHAAAHAHARPDADGPVALARPDAHLAAAQLAVARSWLAVARSWLAVARSWLAVARSWLAVARSWLAVAGSPPSGLLVTVVVSGSGSGVVMICPDPSLASAV